MSSLERTATHCKKRHLAKSRPCIANLLGRETPDVGSIFSISWCNASHPGLVACYAADMLYFSPNIQSCTCIIASCLGWDSTCLRHRQWPCSLWEPSSNTLRFWTAVDRGDVTILNIYSIQKMQATATKKKGTFRIPNIKAT